MTTLPGPLGMNEQEESDQVRDVYAHFGLAIYLAQCIEQSIFQHLLFLDHFPKAIASYTTREAWVSSFDEFESRQLSQTMGKLISRLREVGQPTESIEAQLSQALKQRNWLVHGYFSERAVEFTQPSGCQSMIVELEAIQSLFLKSAEQIDALTMLVAKRYGLSEERLAEMIERMTNQKAELSPNPSSGAPAVGKAM